jgi:quercetin dioxygenase-like cupin family protein
MSKPVIVRPSQVKEFMCSDVYTSKMLLDHTNSGSKKLQINQGTLKAGGALLPASKHGEPEDEYDEVYIILKGSCRLELSGEVKEVTAGDIIFIPGGVYHGLDNRLGTEDLVLLTIWGGVPPQGVNEAYDMRLEQWGKSYVTREKDEQREF